MPIPTLRTKRLTLRPFQVDDAAHVQRLAGVAEQKLGMKFEGIHRQHMRAHGAFEDIAMCAILRSDYNAGREP